MPSIWVEPYQTKKGTKYRIRQEDNDGLRSALKEKFFFKSPANRRVIEIAESLAEGKPILERRKIFEYVKEWLEVKLKTTKQKSYLIAKNNIRPFLEKFHDRYLDTITTAELNQLKFGLLDVRVSNGANFVIRNIKLFFRYCVDLGYIAKNPAGREFKKFKEVDTSVILTRANAIKLYKVSPPKLRRSIYVLYHTGMREGEFLSIRPENIGADEVLVNGKTGRRTIGLTRTTRKLLLSLALRPWKRSSFESSFQRAVKRADIGRFNIHSLRHTWATNFLTCDGVTILELQDAGGWSTLSQVGRYAKVQKKKIIEAMRKLRLS